MRRENSKYIKKIKILYLRGIQVPNTAEINGPGCLYIFQYVAATTQYLTTMGEPEIYFGYLSSLPTVWTTNHSSCLQTGILEKGLVRPLGSYLYTENFSVRKENCISVPLPALAGILLGKCVKSKVALDCASFL